MESKILGANKIILRLIAFFVLFGIIGFTLAFLLLENVIEITEDNMGNIVLISFCIALVEIIIFFLGRFAANKIALAKVSFERKDLKKIFIGTTIYTVIILLLFLTILIMRNRIKVEEWNNDPSIKMAKAYVGYMESYFGRDNTYVKLLKEMDLILNKILIAQIVTYTAGYGVMVFYQYKTLKKKAV